MLRTFGNLALVIPLDLAEQLPVGLEGIGEAKIAVDDVVVGPIRRIRQVFKVVVNLKPSSQPGSHAR